MKGIILAGGSGTRLHPLTLCTSKQLLPVYNKPLIYYPLSTLILAGMKDILIISTEEEQSNFKRLLGNGSKWGVNICYEVQPKPEGLAQAFIIAEDFIGDEPSCLILGDNIFYGNSFNQTLKQSREMTEGAIVYSYHVRDPERYGVIEFDQNGQGLSIEEKPDHPRSNYAVTGLYFYDKNVANMAKKLKPSNRGELEITDLNRMYLEAGLLKVVPLGRGTTWLDAGTFESLNEASNFVRTVENRQGLLIGSLEEVAWRSNFINDAQLEGLADHLLKSGYGKYLKDLLRAKPSF